MFHKTMKQWSLTCQQCPQTPALRSAPPAWRWAGTTWPATLCHTPSPSPSRCFGKFHCGRRQSSRCMLLPFCCHQSHMWSLPGWHVGRSDTGWAPTALLQLSSPPKVCSQIWRVAGHLPDWMPSRHHKGHLWCCQECYTQSLECPPGKQRPGSGSHRLRPGRLQQSTDMPEIWRHGRVKWRDWIRLDYAVQLLVKYNYSENRPWHSALGVVC